MISIPGHMAHVLDVEFPDRGTVRCRLKGFRAPGYHRGEFHMAHAAVLRLQQALDAMDFGSDVRVDPHGCDDDGFQLVDVKFRTRNEGPWYDLAECLIQEGWGVEWDGPGEPPTFDLSNYPIRQTP